MTRQIRVLLIEDEEPVRRATRLLLEKSGYTVRELSSGVGAEAMIEQGIDLVVTDLAMPDRQGVATVRDLRAKFPELPVIVVTATGFAPMAASFGASRCFSKPVLFGELNAAIEKLTGAKTTPQAAAN